MILVVTYANFFNVSSFRILFLNLAKLCKLNSALYNSGPCLYFTLIDNWSLLINMKRIVAAFDSQLKLLKLNLYFRIILNHIP